MSLRAGLLARTSRLEKRFRSIAPARAASGYDGDPVGYAREVLKVEPWAKQIEVARLLLTPPYRVQLRSSHSVGKTWTLAWLTNWFYDTYLSESAAITTAPTDRDVKDLLWTEIRRQRTKAGLGGFIGDAAPEMRTGDDHFAKGFTAGRGESFQGRHFAHMLFAFDEAVGIKDVFWRTTGTMFKPQPGHFWLAAFNPTDTSSPAYANELATDSSGNPLWHVVQMSSLDHPNIAAELAGLPPPYPSAVSRAQFENWLAEWSDPIDAADHNACDLEWPPGGGHWYRCGPEMEARALGRWPSSATYGVWSDALWLAMIGDDASLLTWGPADIPTVGHDPARFGNDYSTFHVRWGPVSLHHERHNGWETKRNAARCKELARFWAEKYNAFHPRTQEPLKPQEIPVHIDGDGLGAGVIDLSDGYRFVSVCGSSRATRPGYYPNRRSENWFLLAERARQGQASFARLPKEHQTRLRQQLMAPEWEPDGMGRNRVEPKEITKKRLGFSPDDADAANLAYTPTPALPIPSVAENETHERRTSPGTPGEGPQMDGRRGMFGR